MEKILIGFLMLALVGCGLEKMPPVEKIPDAELFDQNLSPSKEDNPFHVKTVSESKVSINEGKIQKRLPSSSLNEGITSVGEGLAGIKPRVFTTKEGCQRENKYENRLTVIEEEKVMSHLDLMCKRVDLYRKRKKTRLETRDRYLTKEFLPLISSMHLPTRNLQEWKKTSISKMKKYFTCMITAEIIIVNERILKERGFLEGIHVGLGENGGISEEEDVYLGKLANKYLGERKNISESNKKLVNVLLDRVDIIPTSLALAQAAKESGWGGANDGARFARQAYSLFGQHYSGDQGSMKTCEESAIKVAIFSSTLKSVQSYVHNLNTGRGYKELRDIRKEYRDRGETPDGYGMAGGLGRYSADGEYIKSLRNDFICSYQWQALDNYTVNLSETYSQVSFKKMTGEHPCH